LWCSSVPRSSAHACTPSITLKGSSSTFRHGADHPGPLPQQLLGSSGPCPIRRFSRRGHRLVAPILGFLVLAKNYGVGHRVLRLACAATSVRDRDATKGSAPTCGRGRPRNPRSGSWGPSASNVWPRMDHAHLTAWWGFRRWPALAGVLAATILTGEPP